MTRTQAEAFRDILATAGVGSHVDEIVKNTNGFALVVPNKVRLTQLEEAQRYVNSIGDTKKADA